MPRFWQKFLFLRGISAYKKEFRTITFYTRIYFYAVISKLSPPRKWRTNCMLFWYRYNIKISIKKVFISLPHSVCIWYWIWILKKLKTGAIEPLAEHHEILKGWQIVLNQRNWKLFKKDTFNEKLENILNPSDGFWQLLEDFRTYMTEKKCLKNEIS